MTNYRKTFQNEIFAELNSKKHTPSPTVLRNCGIAQNLSFAKAEKGNFARNDFSNDCANCSFFAQNWCAKKEKFCVSFRKNCAKVLRMETLPLPSSYPVFFPSTFFAPRLSSLYLLLTPSFFPLPSSHPVFLPSTFFAPRLSSLYLPFAPSFRFKVVKPFLFLSNWSSVCTLKQTSFVNLN